MKLLVFLLLFSTTVFSQHKVISETFYEYKYNGKFVTINEYDMESENVFYHIQDGDYIQISTDVHLNTILSDSLTKQFVNGKSVNPKKIKKTLKYLVNNITIDSTTSLLYREVESRCLDCLNSIHNLLMSDKDLINDFKSNGVTDIIVNYVQVKRKKTYGYIFIEIRKRFREDKYHFFSDEMK